MRVKIVMPGASVSVDMEEEKAVRVFQKLAEMMLILAIGSEKCRMLSSSHMELDSEEKTEKSLETEPAEAAEEKPEIIQEGYGGFLYVKCPSCGKVKGFCAKTRISNFRCDCGTVSHLKDMVPLFMECKCGRRARYLTNMTDAVFDMDCYDCGAPVAMEWNEKKKCYETMKN